VLDSRTDEFALEPQNQTASRDGFDPFV